MKIRKAVITAAGLGTRVLPASKAMPKEMIPIVDKPAIQYIFYFYWGGGIWYAVSFEMSSRRGR